MDYNKGKTSDEEVVEGEFEEIGHDYTRFPVKIAEELSSINRAFGNHFWRKY